ncbi:hypothetical protein [Echinicola shivajiensis]|uniref:hypothetical protein n=1 Tax=Echinicola shivajiensis TaxID=1035916 RepID=UPI001BFC7895|nr:hypothetical protein [Echinicola shivajiensis]
MDCLTQITSSPQFPSNRIIYLLILIFLLGSCGESSEPVEENAEAVEEVPEEKVDETNPTVPTGEKAVGGDVDLAIDPEVGGPITESIEFPEIPAPVIDAEWDTAITSPHMPLEDYKAVLEVDKRIKLHQNASLIVWIGDESTAYVADAEAVVDAEVFPARIGQYAKVKPIAPDFEIVPSETGCIKIDPSGSKVQFTLKAIEEGTFEVSAEIQLFDNPNCEGTPVPKTTEHLSVTVEVDKDYRWKNRINKLGEIFWDKFFSFWGALVALVLGFLIYIIRKFLKNKTGYEEGEE